MGDEQTLFRTIVDVGATVFTAGAAIAAWLAAKAASKSAKQSEVTTELTRAALKLEMMNTLLDRRYSSQMYDAKISLRKFRDLHAGSDLTEVYAHAIMPNNEEPLGSHRRRFFMYFRKAKDLHEAQLLDDAELRRLANPSDVELLWNVSRPIERAVFDRMNASTGSDDKFDESLFQFFYNLHPQLKKWAKRRNGMP